MEADKLNLPVSSQILNLAAGLMQTLNLPAARLDEATLTAQAVKETGLTDFGDPYYLEGLRTLLRSCAEDADLHPFGRMVARDMILTYLVQRLKLVEAGVRQPEVFDRALTPPLIVTGMARSGTTFLHNLLSADPVHRAIPQWQLLRPFPVRTASPGEPDPRITLLENAFRLRAPYLPGLDSKHYTRAETPEECIVALGLTFNSLVFPTLFPVEGYMHWYLENANDSNKYRDYRRLLGVFDDEDPGCRLVMKAPAHMGSLGALKEQVPEAMIVQLHRDPVVCIGSVCSLIYTWHRSVSDHMRIERMAELIMQLYETWLRNNLAFRESNPGVIYDVDYRAFVADPARTVCAIYSHFDLPWTDAAAAKLEAFITSHPKGKHGKHQYSLADYGLTEAEVLDRLGFFYGEHIVL